jgi:hypothetical protein
MLGKFGHTFAVTIVFLENTKLLCVPVQLLPGEKQISRERVQAAALHALRKARAAFVISDMDELLPELDRLEQLIWPHVGAAKASLAAIAQAINHLISRIQDELDGHYYFHLTQSDVPFFVDERPFGQQVWEKFSKANDDISEAGKCLALQRPTACVFHLMRALELAVQQLGKKLKVKINVQTETWHQIILHVNKSIESLPSKTPIQKRRKSSYAEVAAHLQSIRLAWRNEVMHPKQAYTRQEAFDIFNATTVFMASLTRVI